jgi:TetR/AcrR family transcriptional regulator, cholesterol catabolism regulator
MTIQVAREQTTAVRRDNRLQVVLDSAAVCFCERGYDAASMRDIAKDAGMKAGSLYYHFPSKSELLVAVHEEGIRRITATVETALEKPGTPRARLEAAMAAHLEALLKGGDYAQVVVRELPAMSEEQRVRLIGLRDAYEGIFKDLIGQLPLQNDRMKRHLRLLLFGALNWTRTWYQSGDETPQEIARGFLELIKET